MSVAMEATSLWDELAEEYDPHRRSRRLWTKFSVWKELFEEAIGEATLILDVGCGAGAMALPLAEKPRIICASDISGGMLKLAKKSAGKCQPSLLNRVFLIRADSHYLPFRSNAFDAVYARFSLWPLKDPCKAVEEMTRVTRINGRIIIAEVNRKEKNYSRLPLRAKIFYKIYKFFSRLLALRKDTSHVWRQLKAATRENPLVNLERTLNWLSAFNCKVVKVDCEVKFKTSTLLSRFLDVHPDYFLLVAEKHQRF